MSFRQKSLEESFAAKASSDSDSQLVRVSLHDSDSDSSDVDFGVDQPGPQDPPETRSVSSHEAGTLELPETESVSSQTGDEQIELELVEKPFQPHSGVFPKRQFGQKKLEYRSFQPSWFNNKLWCDWLHWESKNNRVYCFMCRNVHILYKLTFSKNQDPAFVTSGFNNWKDATRAFELHRRSKCHKEATLKWEHHTRGISVDLQLQRQLAAEQVQARNCLHKIFTSVEYLARQALPLRGHQEERGNLYQLLQLRASDSSELRKWLKQKRSYTSHEIQNEILRIMAHQIQRSILNDVCTSLWYCVSADETVDVSLIEQVSEY